MFADFETAKNSNETTKKHDKTAKKSNTQNVQTETVKKTGNDDNLSSRRYAVMFRISNENSAQEGYPGIISPLDATTVRACLANSRLIWHMS